MIDTKRAIEILEEAISGTSRVSKNSLINEAIKCLKIDIPVEPNKLVNNETGENHVQNG